MHKHYCDVVGHEYKCSNKSCECVCGNLMEGHDHSDCPIELRACPKHPEGTVDASAERSPNAVEIDFSVLSAERQQSPPTCKCGCADLETSVGFCAWCTHRYADYNLRIEADHFLNHCPQAPKQLKDSARKRLASRKRKNGAPRKRK